MRNIMKLAAGVAAMLAPMCAMADGVISGKVVSRDLGEPMDFVTVTLEDGATRSFISGVTTDEDGQFLFPTMPKGEYVVKFSYVGCVPQTRPVVMGDDDIDIGTVRLANDSKVLQEVVVTGVKGQMRFELDRKVFNVDSNIAAAGMSASELLEAIPSVEVDQDGEVSLRGNSSVTVWINGKDSGLTSDNRAQILEQIPAETIERIEVITNPSAKFSPEGTAGIINIVLKKNRASGYFGSAELGANTKGGANANFNINANFGRWETFAGLGLRMRHNSGGSHSRRDYEPADGGDQYYLYSDGNSRNHGDNAFLRLGVTFHATDKDEAHVSGFGMLGHHWGHSSTLYTSNLPGQWSVNNNRSGNRGDMRGAHVEIGYKHLWTDTRYLDITASLNRWGGPMRNNYLQQYAYADDTHEDIYQEQASDIGSNSYEVKADYTNQINSWLKLEAGYNGNFSREDTPTTTWEGTSPEDMVLAESLYNRFLYDNDINALYATLGGKVGSFSFSGGVRAEAWQVRARSLAYGENENEVPQFKKDNFALFPSAFLSYSLPHDNELQINYTRRIRRPWGGQLNSFRNISDPTNISYGNPELEPQYSNSFELNYLKTWTNHMISLSAYLRTSDKVTNRISYLDGDVLYTTWANAGKQTNSGAEIVAKNSFFRCLDITTTLNLYNSHLSAWNLDFVNGDKTFNVSGKAQNSFAWDVRCMASVRLPWQLSFQATGRYNSRQISAQGSREPGWSVDAGLRKMVGNWSFSINARDIFDSRRWHNRTIGQGYTQDSEHWWGGRQVQFTVKYSFGNMNSNRRPGMEDMNGGEPMDGSGYSTGGME